MANATVVTGTNPVVVSANPCRLIGIYPTDITTRTVTVTDGGTDLYTLGIGSTQSGQFYGDLGFRVTGVTVKLSVDEPVLVLWAPL